MQCSVRVQCLRAKSVLFLHLRVKRCVCSSIQCCSAFWSKYHRKNKFNDNPLDNGDKAGFFASVVEADDTHDIIQGRADGVIQVFIYLFIIPYFIYYCFLFFNVYCYYFILFLFLFLLLFCSIFYFFLCVFSHLNFNFFLKKK